MVIVKKVETKKEQREFIDFPIKLYEGNEYFVPYLRSGEKAIFKSSLPYNKVCEVAFFNAYRDGKIVGRIQGIIQTEANLKWDQKRARFTRFDVVDDAEVSKALFDAFTSWAKEKGMNEVVGPLGYSDLEREGLLIEGFEELQTFEEQYNYPYYQKLIEDYGFSKDVDWVECTLRAPKESSDKLLRVSNKMLDKYGLRIVQETSVNRLIKNYAKPLFEMIDKTYSRLYGTMPLNDEIVSSLVKDFKMILRPKDVALIMDKEDKVVGFALLFPSISDVVRKSKGRITLPFLIRFIKTKKHPKVLDLGLIGISPEYESKGVITALIGLLVEFLEKGGAEHLETNLMLENNTHILNLMKHFDHTFNKRRRCFKMDI